MVTLLFDQKKVKSAGPREAGITLKKVTSAAM